MPQPLYESLNFTPGLKKRGHPVLNRLITRPGRKGGPGITSSFFCTHIFTLVLAHRLIPFTESAKIRNLAICFAML